MSPRDDIEAVLVAKPFAHHASHSGYTQLATHLGRSLWWNPGVGSVEQAWVGAPYLNRWYDAAALRREMLLAKLATRRRNTLFHFLYADSDFRVAPLLSNSKGVWVGTFHQPADRIEAMGLDAASIRRIDLAIVVGSSQVGVFKGWGVRQVAVVPHGVDIGFFGPDEAVPTSGRVLTVGGWLRNFELYNEVTALAEKLKSSLRFVAVVPAKHASRLRPSTRVSVLSNISDVELREQYRRSSCLFLPLHDATANNALLEALACGLPCVVSDVGSIRDYLDETAGELVVSDDPLHWLYRLEDAADVNHLHAARRTAAQALAERFSWTRVAEQTVRAYRTAIREAL